MSPLDNAYRELGVEVGVSDLQMPNVFVTPPEEDQVPTWCCFDAANPSFSQLVERPGPNEISPIAFSPDEAYYMSMAHVANATTMSVVDDAMASRHPEFEDDIETISDYGHELDDEDIPSSAANDSDVVEVVKLRRHDRLQEAPESATFQQQPSHTKQPNSLKSRASRAFKSLATSLRSKSKTSVTVSSSSSRSSSQNERDGAQSRQEQAPPISRSRTPTALRRGSGVLSQLFTTPIETRSSMSSFGESALASPTSPTHPRFSFSDSYGSAQSRHLPSSMYSYHASLPDQSLLEAPSPAPTTSSRKSSRRFSILSLQKLFSFGPATPVPAEEVEDDNNLANIVQSEVPEVATAATPVLRSVPSTPAFSSSSSNSGPETPTSAHYQFPVRLVTSSTSVDGVPDFPAFDTLDGLFDSNQNLNLGLGLGLNLPATGASSGQHTEPSTPRKTFSPTSRMWGSITPKGRKRYTSSPDDADESLEMRLDSLHFDSLSFDLDHFSLK